MPIAMNPNRQISRRGISDQYSWTLCQPSPTRTTETVKYTHPLVRTEPLHPLHPWASSYLKFGSFCPCPTWRWSKRHVLNSFQLPQQSSICPRFSVSSTHAPTLSFSFVQRSLSAVHSGRVWGNVPARWSQRHCVRYIRGRRLI
ncbi:hypothetical protein B0H19DRAFT_385234 [Mycena capillaripes]|nr:hypothetical protein B0H19DRAFT_385234 [Mycena capillaripes]